jgi:hypothetical protein
MSENSSYVDMYYTFGVQYKSSLIAYETCNSRIVHPYWPLADADGWLRIRAINKEVARGIAFLVTDGIFAFEYSEPISEEYAHLGELAFINTLPYIKD